MPPPRICAAATQGNHQCSRFVWGNETLCGQHANMPNVRLFENLPANQRQPVRPRCVQCGRFAVIGFQHCPWHEAMRPRPDLPPEQRCVHRGCMRVIDQHQRCVRHVNGFIQRHRAVIWQDMYEPAVIQVVERPDMWREVIAEWNRHIGEPFIDAGFVQTLEINMARELRIAELWNRHMGGHAPMDALGNIGWRIFENDDDDFINAPRRPPPRTELEGFARDTQNIHTRVVTEQTNTALNILLNAEVPAGQKTVTESHMAFMGHIAAGRIATSLEKIGDVDRDVKRWYRVSSCRADGDYLYKRTLDGLWAKIKTSSERQELEIRLWQEMVDSLGMCCDGHISRLTNVLSGFDEAFAPQLSPAELLQNRMAVISGMDGGIILQVAEALTAFKELKVPQDQWEAWIDAL